LKAAICRSGKRKASGRLNLVERVPGPVSILNDLGFGRKAKRGITVPVIEFSTLRIKIGDGSAVRRA